MFFPIYLFFQMVDQIEFVMLTSVEKKVET